MYGAFGSPSTLDFEWFSSMITKMCLGLALVLLALAMADCPATGTSAVSRAIAAPTRRNLAWGTTRAMEHLLDSATVRRGRLSPP